MSIVKRLMRLSLAATAVFLPALAANTSGAATPEICYRGINLSGAEYGDRGGVLGTNYTYPSEATVRYFARKGMNVVRLPFKWERLQPTLGQPLDTGELQHLKDAVELIRKNGMAVVLDPHNFGYYDKTQVTQRPATDIAFGDFWARLAVEFANENGVLFGLMNEPHDIKAPDWLNAANTAIRSIRTVGARNLILVPGTIWSGAWTWSQDRLGGGSNASVMIGVKDPLDYYAYEFHQYLDADSSGTHATCEGADQARQGLVEVTNWLRQNKKRGFLGEFGAGANDPCLNGLTQMLDVMNQNSDVWLGWTYWAAGDWWPPEEPLNVQPRNGRDKPQMKVLTAGLSKKALPAPACTAVKPGN
ncbi:glycoside hydrolase family 5 protein [Rhizobium sp. BK376]|uniref:glycoside hydrolase family 5 protein n=1 Tax=Rhizobium sp. BK376 TaxID=2512149 RepID=UPI00104FF993|nr:glycoside hydrolase family 5 protein [Rhizobium sp. BK376]TCR90697.1 cellulase (glycosyl hydrolase family 5) [Rhizobium sp. BK376]